MLATHQQPAKAVDPFTSSEWEDALSATPRAAFFHSTVWARILVGTYGFSPYYLAAGELGSPSLLPIMEANSFISGRRGVALPFTDECDPITTDASKFDLLWQTAVSHAKSRKWRYIEVRGGAAGLPTTRTSAEFLGHEIVIEGHTPADLFAKCTSAARRAVRKAEKSGVIVEFSRRREDMESFYSLLCKTRKRHGNPPQPIQFFWEIHKHAINTASGLLVLAKHDGAVIAGAVFLHHGRSAIYKFGASDWSYRELCANNMVMWKALAWYCEQGFAAVRLGRTSLDNEGLRRFKLSWGAREYPIKYFRYVVRAGEFVTGRDNSSGWQTRIFKLLPQRVSRSIGAFAYRHIA